MEDDQQIKNLKMGMNICTKTVSAVVSLNLRDNVALENALDELRTMMKNYIGKEHEYMDKMSAIANARAKLRDMSDNAREQLGEDGMEAIFRKEHDKLRKKSKTPLNPSKHTSMVCFEEEVVAEKTRHGLVAGNDGEGGSEGDEDLVMTQTTGSHLDPITRMPMKDPVKNTKCGHSYERASIQHLTRKGKKTKCPIAGCPNQDYVRPEDLIDDTALKREIDMSGRKNKK